MKHFAWDLVAVCIIRVSVIKGVPAKQELTVMYMLYSLMTLFKFLSKRLTVLEAHKTIQHHIT